MCVRILIFASILNVSYLQQLAEEPKSIKFFIRNHIKTAMSDEDVYFLLPNPHTTSPAI